MKNIGKIIAIFAMCICLTGSSCQRNWKDVESSWTGGLYREVYIYSLVGTLIASHEGKIDIEDRENSILFDMEGKRYIYYNAIIEVVEK